MSKFPKKTLADWEAQAKKLLKKDDLSDFKWDTPEGISVKPLYTAADLEKLELRGQDQGNDYAVDQG